MTATSVVRLGTKAAAEYLGGLPESTLRYWRYMGTGPRSYRLGRHTFYDIADLDAWIEAEAAKTERGGRCINGFVPRIYTVLSLHDYPTPASRH